MQIVVVGMHRSGTSALTRVLGLLGCWLGEPGDFNPIEPDNPKGYWERRDVWTLNEAMLESQGATWSRVADFAIERFGAEAREGFERRARAIVAGLDPHGTWAIKDPRICLVLPVWRAALTRPVFVLCVRRPLQVARSLQARNGFPLAVGAALWERHVLAALADTAGMPRLLVQHEQLMGDPATTAADLLAGLESRGVRGLRLPEPETLREFVDPALFRAHGSGEEEATLLNPVQRELWQAVTDGSALRRGHLPERATGCDDLLRGWGDAVARCESAEAALGAREARIGELEPAYAEASRQAAAAEGRAAAAEGRAAAAEGRAAAAQSRAAAAESRADAALRRADELAARLQAAEDQLRELSGELRDALERGDELLRRARGAEERAALADDLRAHGDALYQQVQRAANLFDQQQALLDLVLRSRRYRFAEVTGETARRLTLRRAQPAAAEHAQRIRAEYASWRRALVERHGLPPLEADERGA